MIKKAFTLLLSFAILLSSLPAQAADERRLKLYFLHTKENLDIVYKRNGRYIPSALKRINHFLRDWRENEPTKMDPRLLDLIWSVYQELETDKPIHIVSAYRSPKTNDMLRRRSSGVAKRSQHMKGKALDFFVPGVPLSKIRNIGLKMEVGGVGYYPASGSPFVHLDTGSVRHWPRMTEGQLAKIFPRGDTTHIGTNGKRLKGYEEGMARRQKMVKGEISPLTNTRGGGLFARVFGRGGQEPAALPTVGQSVTSSDAAPGSIVMTAAAPLDIAPRQKPPLAQPAEPLEDIKTKLDMALASTPPPRPIAEQFQSAQQQALAADAPVPVSPAAPALSQDEALQTTEIARLIAQQNSQEQTDVAAIVMSALQASQAREAQDLLNEAESASALSGPSAAASIAAVILAQPPLALENEAGIAPDSFLTAYAPSAPIPHSRPVFETVRTLGGKQLQAGAAQADRPPFSQEAATQPLIASASSTPYQQPLLPEGTIPRSAHIQNAPSLIFDGYGPAVLRRLSNPQTIRGVAFARLVRPAPEHIAHRFALPEQIVDNRFSLNYGQTMRADRFSGRAIVAMRMARL